MGGVESRKIGVNGRSFVVGNAIGFGSFATVFQIQDEETGEEYACKEIRKEFLSKHKNIFESTKREKEILSRVCCPTIVPLYCTLQDNASLFMVMGLLLGGDLTTHIQRAKKKRKSFSEEMIRFVAASALHSLYYLHKHGIIHADVKSSNLLLDEDGYVFLTDFNQSIFLSENYNEMRGTFSYTAPEVYEGSYNEKIDMWSLGVTLFELAFLTTPWKLPQTKEETHFQSTEAGKEHLKKVKRIALKRNIPSSRHTALSRILRMSLPPFPPLPSSFSSFSPPRSPSPGQTPSPRSPGQNRSPRSPSSPSSSSSFSPEFHDLLERLICPPRKRLTAGEAKNHPFFSSFSWESLEEIENENVCGGVKERKKKRNISPPFVPEKVSVKQRAPSHLPMQGNVFLYDDSVGPPSQPSFSPLSLFEEWNWALQEEERVSFNCQWESTKGTRAFSRSRSSKLLKRVLSDDFVFSHCSFLGDDHERGREREKKGENGEEKEEGNQQQRKEGEEREEKEEQKKEGDPLEPFQKQAKSQPEFFPFSKQISTSSLSRSRQPLINEEGKKGKGGYINPFSSDVGERERACSEPEQKKGKLEREEEKGIRKRCGKKKEGVVRYIGGVGPGSVVRVGTRAQSTPLFQPFSLSSSSSNPSSCIPAISSNSCCVPVAVEVIKKDDVL